MRARWDFILGNAGAGILDAQILSAEAVPSHLQPDLPALRVNLMEFDSRLSTIWVLARSSPQMRGMPCSNHLVNGDAAARGAQF